MYFSAFLTYPCTEHCFYFIPLVRGWDQFEANEALFGIKSTFDEDLYTTKLEKGPQMKDLEREALRIAREIEGEDTHDLHLAEVLFVGFFFYETIASICSFKLFVLCPFSLFIWCLSNTCFYDRKEE